RKVCGNDDAPGSHFSFVGRDMTDAFLLLYLKGARTFKDVAAVTGNLFDQRQQIFSGVKTRLICKANCALDLEGQRRRLFIGSRKTELRGRLYVSRDALQLILTFRINISICARKVA